VITAGGSGIGRVIAETFSRNGARVHVCDIDEKSLEMLCARIPEVSVTRADVSSLEETDQLFQDAVDIMGGLDILINNAGIAGPTDSAEKISPVDWNRTLAVNINGQFYCARLAIPLLKKAGGGCVVNLSSAAIWKGGYPMRLPYAVSKKAVLGLTETLAMESGPYNIRVNSVLPGTVEGARMYRVLNEREKATGIPAPEILKRAVSSSSMRSSVAEQEVADLILFLCSDKARHISGQTISVCGNFEGHHSAEGADTPFE
jgi:NAD(P)-dependent dehydrogenase (short-subunit alcohol dehydrogenase family)